MSSDNRQIDARLLEPPSVAAAIVAHDRPDDLQRLLAAMARQNAAILATKIVDNGVATATEIVSAKFSGVTHLNSNTNLGGAGGFSYAILSALATGANWIWVMDDDAYPTCDDCLANLIKAAEERRLDLVSPIIVAPDDHSRLSFPVQVKGKLSYDRRAAETLEFLPSIAHLFNGALIRREVFFKIGLPDMKLFIRGDEVDFLLRLRKAKVPFGTITNIAVAHPPGWNEVVPIVMDRIHILLPETNFKRFYFFRNRGFLARRHRRWRSFIGDVVLYPYVFLFKQKGNWNGLFFWANAYWKGFSYNFEPMKSVGGEK